MEGVFRTVNLQDIVVEGSVVRERRAMVDTETCCRRRLHGILKAIDEAVVRSR